MNGFQSISLFWTAALGFITVALGLVLPTLLRRRPRPPTLDPAATEQALRLAQETELEADLRVGTLASEQLTEARRDLADNAGPGTPSPEPAADTGASGRRAGFVLAAAIPVAAIGLYLALGSPEHLASAPAPAVSEDKGQHDPAAMVAALEERLRQNPEDGPGWAMLGRSYVALGRSQEGARALEKAAGLVPGDARLLADYAEAVALNQGRNLAGVPSALIARALAFNERDEKALMLAGAAASQRQDYAQATAYWRRLLAVLPQDTELARQVSAAIAKAEEASAPTDVRSAMKQMLQQPPQTAPASVAGTVTLSGSLAGRVNPADTVFIYAQAPQGSRAPLAIQRITAGQMPYRFTLDDSMAMGAGAGLSASPEVLVTARVSKSGLAMAKSGDLQGTVGPVKLGRTDIVLSIDTVVP